MSATVRGLLVPCTLISGYAFGIPLATCACRRVTDGAVGGSALLEPPSSSHFEDGAGFTV